MLCCCYIYIQCLYCCEEIRNITFITLLVGNNYITGLIAVISLTESDERSLITVGNTVSVCAVVGV